MAVRYKPSREAIPGAILPRMSSDRQRLRVTYRLAPVSGVPDRTSHPQARARAVARESTLEVPEGVASPGVEAALLGVVESVEAEEDGSHRAVISHAPEILDEGLPQLLNVLHGNISLLPGVRLVDVALPEGVLDRFPGPRFGISGIRDLLGAQGRPLVAAAIKPVGLSPEELARVAEAFVRAGVDIIKDDHSLANQRHAPFLDRIRTVAEAVARTRGEAGTGTLYFPTVTGPTETLLDRADAVGKAGCAGVLISPGLMGLDAMRWLSAEGGLPVMSHPSRADVAPGRDSGVAPEVHFGLLHRLAGADAVVYVNAGGRFHWSVEECQAVNRRLRAPLGRLKPSFPVPAGGVEADDAPTWFRRYGTDTLLLIGGSLLKQRDVEGAARRLVEQARAAVG